MTPSDSTHPSEVLAGPTLAGPTADRSPASPRRPERSRIVLLYLVSILLGIGIYWLLAATAFASQDTLPTPPQIVSAAHQLAADGELWSNVEPSLLRVVVGFSIGVAVAIPIGFLMGWYRTGRGLLEPWIQFFRTVPPLALTPMVIIFFGIGETAKVFLIFLASFLATVIATFQGVRSVEVTLIKAARVLGANDWVVFRRVVVPASLPFIFTGARIGLGSSWATLVAAELVAASSGLGHLMETSAQYYDTANIVVAIICIGLLGFLMDRILLALEARLTAWQSKRES